MKILLDENIDVKLKEEFPEFDISTVRNNGWTGIENGKLLELAIQNNYEVFITLDSNLKYQQNLTKYNLHILVIKAKDSRLNHLKLFTLKIKNLLNSLVNKTEFEILEIYL